MKKSTQNSRRIKRSQKARKTQDVLSTCNKNVDKFFDEMEKAISYYHTSIEDIQKEYAKYWRQMCDSLVSAQKEFKGKSDMKAIEPYQRMASNAFEVMSNTWKTQNQLSHPVIKKPVRKSIKR